MERGRCPVSTILVGLTFYRTLNVRLLNLLDGSPHELPLHKVLSLNWRHHDACQVDSWGISGNRIALLVESVGFIEREGRRELVVWD
jgi:hypothetical protein